MKILRTVFLWSVLGLILIGCNATPTVQTANSASTTPMMVATATATAVEDQASLPTATSTPQPTAAPLEASPLSSDTPTAGPVPSATPQPEVSPLEPLQIEGGLVIDHQAVMLFDQIPDRYLQAASEITWLHRHASVGANLRFGLDCLMNYFPDRADPNRRPSACDRDLDPADIVYGAQYNSGNWTFEVHADTNPNPGWYNKARNFIKRINSLEPGESYQYASFNFGYVEDPTILDYYFNAANADSNFPSIFDLETLQAEHPEITFIWWTSALARQTPDHILQFNQQMRDYARTNNLILFDIGDIESHRPDGTACTGVDASANPTDVTAVCDEYANETFAGHLNADASNRVAKAVWVMMAILAGWDGVSQ